MKNIFPRPGIYAILDGQPYEMLLTLGEKLLSAPLCAMQIRAKSISEVEREQLTRALFEKWQRLSQPKPLFVINDDWNLAKQLGVALHLGQNDMPLSEARRELGKDAVVGISTHNPEQAVSAQEHGATYIGFGPLYPTQSKKNPESSPSQQDLENILRQITIPVVGIGGLTPERIVSLYRRGLRYFAVLSALHDDGFFDFLQQFEVQR